MNANRIMSHLTPYTREYDLSVLVRDYYKFGRIIVAYDYDGTVHPDDEYQVSTCDQICKLLEKCSHYTDDIDMICYTCRGDITLYTEVIPYLDEKGIRHDKLNENSDHIPEEKKETYSSKILYTIFLENRAGLLHTYHVLSNFLAWLRVKREEIPDMFGFTEMGLIDLR